MTSTRDGKNQMKIFASRRTDAVKIIPVKKIGFKKWMDAQPVYVKRWIKTVGFDGAAGNTCLIPNNDGSLGKVLWGVSDIPNIWDSGSLARGLPHGTYTFEGFNDAKTSTLAALGWGLGAYRFDKYKNSLNLKTLLQWPAACDRKIVEQTLEAIFLVRDLINTPAEDMGPSELEKAARTLAKKYQAKIKVIKGKQLLTKNYPAIHAIGRASDDEPRLLDLTWGKPTHPKVTLIGKGVCFDTGGLDIKPASGMKLMKKDMGGAAHVLGLASMLMSSHSKVRLRVLIPAVENNIAGNAIRPLDIIRTRNGKTIEIGHTDAEGRVILADALSEAARDNPGIIIDFATLTGAARVALGTELPALFTNDDEFAKTLLASGISCQDELWRMPLWSDYRCQIKGKTADLTNSAESGFGGAITAALFLQEFVEPTTSWAHIDLMAWNTTTRPGRPEGGEAMGLRAVYQAILVWIGK